VSRASVTAAEGRAEIGRGLVVFAGIEAGDDEDVIAWCAKKIASLRIFEDAEGKMNLGLAEVEGAVLAVSQFTLAGSIERGRRPSFDRAMAPEGARPLFERFVALLRSEGLRVETGFFRSHMAVELINDGPVTFVLDRA
jgi:D-tyrosyl-tRNA(Tyr) deacylase